MHDGGCQCGAIRYRITRAPEETCACHCTTCRRLSGAPFIAWVSVPVGDFVLLQGRPKLLRVSDRAERSFCGDCGTPLTFQFDAQPESIDITTCSLDDPAVAPPARHIWTQSQLPWLHLDDGLPRFAQRAVKD